MWQPIVKDLTSKAKDFIKCPQGHGLEDFITEYNQQLREEYVKVT